MNALGFDTVIMVEWNFRGVINLVMIPAIVFLGFLGNIVTLLVMAIAHFRPSSAGTAIGKLPGRSAMYIYITALRQSLRPKDFIDTIIAFF